MLDEEAYVVLVGVNRRDRRKLESAFDHLRDHPFAEPSFVGLDSNDEEQFHLFLPDYSIAYHVDHAVKLVFIQQILSNS
jgi:hypothetical protein